MTAKASLEWLSTWEKVRENRAKEMKLDILLVILQNTEAANKLRKMPITCHIYFTNTLTKFFLACLNEVCMHDMHQFLLKSLKVLNQLPGMFVTFQTSPSHHLEIMLYF